MDTPQPKAEPFDFVGYLGADELNWAEYPLFSPTKYNHRTQQTLLSEHVTDCKLGTGQKITRTQEIVASQKYGLPTDRDGDVLMALIAQLVRWNKDGTYEIKSPRVLFARRQLLLFMKWNDGGIDYKRLRESLHRWIATSIHYTNWWYPIHECYDDLAFNVLASFKGFNSRFDDEGDDYYYVEFTDEFLKALGGNWLKRISLDTYYSLRNPTAKLIFRFLDKRCRNGQLRTFDLRTFATQHIGMKGTDTQGKPLAISKFRDRLAPALAELESIGFIAPWPKEQRFGRVSGGEQEIRFERQEIKQPENHSNLPLIADMVELGLWEDKATEYASDPKYSDDYLTERVEWVRWMIETDNQKNKIADAGAVLRSLIENPKRTPPPNFETTKQRAERLEKINADKIAKAKAKAKQKEDEARQKEEDKQRSEQLWQRVKEYQEQLTPIELAEFERRVLDGLTNDFERQFVRKFLKEPEKGSFGRDSYSKAALALIEQGG